MKLEIFTVLALALYSCVAEAPPLNCPATAGCRSNGLCTEQAGACWAVKRSDCATTDPCLLAGFCTPQAGRCVIGSEDDCVQSGFCMSYGRCYRSANGLTCTSVKP